MATDSHETLESALRADIARLQREQAAQRRANTEPLPGPLADAFDPTERQVLGFHLRPVVASDFILLKKLNSPLYRHMFDLAEHQRAVAAGEQPEGSEPPTTPYDEEECVEMVYQFTIPVAQARGEILRGREYFRERAHAGVTDRAPIGALPKLVAAVIAHFVASYSTVVPFGSDTSDDQKTVFTTQPGANATVSGGGSTTSPNSAEGIPRWNDLSRTHFP
jgi:hypothetical protein